MGRPTWDEWASGLAAAVATRADCTRSKVGAIIIDAEHRIVSAGYNGAPPGEPGCLTSGACPRARNLEQLGVFPPTYENCIAIHAEANAIVYAGRDRCKGATIYTTKVPCHECVRLIAAAGIARVVVSEGTSA